MILLRQTLLLVTLALLSFLDLKKGVVILWWMLPAAACGLFCNMGDRQWLWNLIAALVFTLCGSGLSIWTDGGIGLGDVWVLGCICLNEGGSMTLLLLLSALFMAAIYGGIKIQCKKSGKKDTVRFVPFLTAGYVLVLALAGA